MNLLIGVKGTIEITPTGLIISTEVNGETKKKKVPVTELGHYVEVLRIYKTGNNAITMSNWKEEG